MIESLRKLAKRATVRRVSAYSDRGRPQLDHRRNRPRPTPNRMISPSSPAMPKAGRARSTAQIDQVPGRPALARLPECFTSTSTAMTGTGLGRLASDRLDRPDRFAHRRVAREGPRSNLQAPVHPSRPARPAQRATSEQETMTYQPAIARDRRALVTGVQFGHRCRRGRSALAAAGARWVAGELRLQSWPAPRKVVSDTIHRGGRQGLRRASADVSQEPAMWTRDVRARCCPALGHVSTSWSTTPACRQDARLRRHDPGAVEQAVIGHQPHRHVPLHASSP